MDSSRRVFRFRPFIKHSKLIGIHQNSTGDSLRLSHEKKTRGTKRNSRQFRVSQNLRKQSVPTAFLHQEEKKKKILVKYIKQSTPGVTKKNFQLLTSFKKY